MDLRAILEKPVGDRAALLSQYLNRLSLRELCVVYPLIVDNVFGTGADATSVTRRGWALDVCSQSLDPYQFRALHEFLKPRGAMMVFASKLTNDASIKFPFPFSRLPVSTFKSFLLHAER
jgi:hypothetical protein